MTDSEARIVLDKISEYVSNQAEYLDPKVCVTFQTALNIAKDKFPKCKVIDTDYVFPGQMTFDDIVK